MGNVIVGRPKRRTRRVVECEAAVAAIRVALAHATTSEREQIAAVIAGLLGDRESLTDAAMGAL